jgi:hypothetical protein
LVEGRVRMRMRAATRTVAPSRAPP